MSIKILLADDHNLVRQGLKSLLEQSGFEVSGEASEGKEAVRKTKELRPDVAVLDIGMRPMNGIDAAREILSEMPKMKVILLTMYTDESYVLDALQAGVTGYVVKTEAGMDLVNAIQEVCAGSTYLSPKVSRAIVHAYLQRGHSSGDHLTMRERQVLQLIAEGKTTKEIASLLGIATKTAEAHRSKIASKIATRGTAGLVRYAIRRGLVQP